MPVWVLALQRQGTSYKVTVPKSWVLENLELKERIMYMVTKDVGVLELHSERSYYAKYLSKGSNESDKGTLESGEGQNRQGVADRVVGESKDPGPVATDNFVKRC